MNTLQPKEVFSIFHEITKIPRPSKHEQQIHDWLLSFAAQHNIEASHDEAGNVIMRAPASPGYEAHKGVILQAHMDMVCEKNKDTKHDFMHDPIQTYIDGDWLKAKGTTLGADNGIGVAMALAALISPSLKHPALEALFTVDEETGLTGAFRLQDGMLKGQQLINLDSEDDGQVFIGCAGGIDTLARLHYQPQSLPVGQWFAAKIKVSGLLGGHSGDDINKGRANANKLLVRYLFTLLQHTDLHIAFIDGGNLRNAIAREAEAVVCVPFAFKEQMCVLFNHFVAEMESESADIETTMALTLESEQLPDAVLSQSVTEKLILSLYACPHGVVAMSKDMPGLVETSTNLASVKMTPDCITINTSQRSSVESQKHDIKNQVECALRLSGADVTHGDGYPGWKPNVNSDLLKVAYDAYQQLTGKQPQVKAIHAGLECGLFLQKYPYLDMISIGPQMTGVHSPMEQLSISSTQTTWNWLKHILSAL